MFTPDETGITEAQRTQASVKALRAQGKTEDFISSVYPNMKQPEPGPLVYLLDIFRDLSAARNYLVASNGVSSILLPQAISYTELRAYREVMELDVDALEAEVIRILDIAFLEETSAVREKQERQKPKDQG